jgi:deazaflavin-dependent oxidoreductase (nitroreductase family)
MVSCLYSDANAFHRYNRRLGATRPVAWFYARTLPLLDRLVFQLTGGRTTFATLVSGLPVIMLTTTGARTESPRTRPVLGLPDGDALIVIGSNWGQRPHPGWYHNLRAHPRASFTHAGRVVDVLASEVHGRDRERCFELATLSYPGFAHYRRRAAHREIGVFRLQPVNALEGASQARPS